MSGKAPSSAKRPYPIDVEGWVREWWHDFGSDPNRSFRYDFREQIDELRLCLRKKKLNKAALTAELEYHNELLPPGGTGPIIREPESEAEAEFYAREQVIEVLNTEIESRFKVAVNIDRLRKECGWSFDALASETGIDKKSIISHVNEGVMPTQGLLEEYAQAFTKKLKRKITVAKLQK